MNYHSRPETNVTSQLKLVFKKKYVEILSPVSFVFVSTSRLGPCLHENVLQGLTLIKQHSLGTFNNKY